MRVGDLNVTQAGMAPLPDGPKKHLYTHVGLKPGVEEHWRGMGGAKCRPCLQKFSGQAPRDLAVGEGSHTGESPGASRKQTEAQGHTKAGRLEYLLVC